MTMTTTLRRPALERSLAMRLAATEYDRCVELFASLSGEQWSAPTECAAWDVRQMAAHMLGMVEMAASIRESSRQQKLAKAAAGVFIDELTGLQVRERQDWSGERIAARYAARAGKALRARKMAPGFIRRRSMGVPQDVDGVPEDWSLGYLLDTILTRDPWMHRMDIVRATGTAARLTADHDGVLVADVVAEWAARHGRPFTLRLTGAAGGTWEHSVDGEQLELDAVDFCRVVSGRGGAEQRRGLLATEVPF